MKAELHRPIREVTSASNPALKVYRRALAEGVTREGWLAVEGPHLLEEALAAGAAIQSALVRKTAAQKFRGILARLPEEAEVIQIADKLFAQISATPSPQGLAALVEPESHRLDAL